MRALLASLLFFTVNVVALDAVNNFGKATVSTGYTAVATTVVLQTGHGAKLPTPPYNLVWWNASLYSDPSDDPSVEIVRVTGKSTDTLTVVRAQESTSATAKNITGSTYKMIRAITAKDFSDLSGGGGGAFSSITSGTNTTATMTVGNGATLVSSGGGIVQWNGNATGTIAVSPSSDGRIIYDSTLQHFYLSENGGAYTQIAAAGAGASFSAITSGTNSTATMTVGTGASLTTSGSGTITATGLSISGQTGILTVTGLTSTNRIKTVRDAADTILELGGSYTPTGTWTSLTQTNPVINSDTVNAAIQHLAETTTTASGYTLVLTDDCKVVTVNTAGANTLSIPTNASVAFPIGTQITVTQKGAGQWTIQAVNSGTTTVVSNAGTTAQPKLRAQYSAATLWKDATDHWYVWGDIQ